MSENADEKPYIHAIAESPYEPEKTREIIWAYENASLAGLERMLESDAEVFRALRLCMKGSYVTSELYKRGWNLERIANAKKEALGYDDEMIGRMMTNHVAIQESCADSISKILSSKSASGNSERIVVGQFRVDRMERDGDRNYAFLWTTLDSRQRKAAEDEWGCNTKEYQEREASVCFHLKGTRMSVKVCLDQLSIKRFLEFSDKLGIKNRPVHSRANGESEEKRKERRREKAFRREN